MALIRSWTSNNAIARELLSCQEVLGATFKVRLQDIASLNSMQEVDVELVGEHNS